MKDRSTVRSRILGGELHRLRKRAGLSLQVLADYLDCSASRLSRLETGKRGVPDTDLAAYLVYCRVARPVRDRLLDLHRDSRSTTWVQPHGDRIPDELASLLHAESTATSITSYDPQVLSPLLQTKDYARAVFHRSMAPTGDIERYLQARSRRQEVQRQLSSPRFTFYIPEPVLRAPVCTPQVMHDQLVRLARIASSAECTIRVVPNPPFGSAFEQITGKDHDPVVIIETAAATLFLEDPQQTAAYSAILTQLARVAYDEHRSRRLILGLADPRFAEGRPPHLAAMQEGADP